MNTLEAIEQRRSIRKFKDTPLSDDQIRAILQAAIQAPSGKNLQPWRFIVVQDAEKRAEMIRIMRTAPAFVSVTQHRTILPMCCDRSANRKMRSLSDNEPKRNIVRRRVMPIAAIGSSRPRRILEELVT